MHPEIVFWFKFRGIPFGPSRSWKFVKFLKHNQGTNKLCRERKYIDAVLVICTLEDLPFAFK